MRMIFRRIADYIRECDKILYILCIATTIFGCVAVLSATYYTSGGSTKDFFTQIAALGVGLIAVIFISNFNYKNFCRFWPLIAFLGLVPVILTFFIGYAPGNTDDKAWLMIGGFSFQPSELLKICFVISFGYHCFRIGNKVKNFWHTCLLCIHGSIPIVLIHFQGDDGTALVFACMFVCMMFVAGVKLRYFIIALCAATVALPFAYFFVMNDDQRARIEALFLAPKPTFSEHSISNGAAELEWLTAAGSVRDFLRERLSKAVLFPKAITISYSQVLAKNWDISVVLLYFS